MIHTSWIFQYYHLLTFFKTCPNTDEMMPKVNLLVEHRSLYATYGKVHGRFLDQADK